MGGSRGREPRKAGRLRLSSQALPGTRGSNSVTATRVATLKDRIPVNVDTFDMRPRPRPTKHKLTAGRDNLGRLCTHANARTDFASTPEPPDPNL